MMSVCDFLPDENSLDSENDGKEQYGLPELQKKDETAVHWSAALSMRDELEKRYWLL